MAKKFTYQQRKKPSVNQKEIRFIEHVIKKIQRIESEEMYGRKLIITTMNGTKICILEKDQREDWDICWDLRPNDKIVVKSYAGKIIECMPE